MLVSELVTLMSRSSGTALVLHTHVAVSCELAAHVLQCTSGSCLVQSSAARQGSFVCIVLSGEQAEQYLQAHLAL